MSETLGIFLAKFFLRIFFSLFRSTGSLGKYFVERTLKGKECNLIKGNLLKIIL
jgi:hypothetical protein